MAAGIVVVAMTEAGVEEQEAVAAAVATLEGAVAEQEAVATGLPPPLSLK